jgi:signal transduction histidine kinase
MKKELVLVLFLLVNISFSQNNRTIDSLLLSLKKGSEKQKNLTLINISDEYSNFDLDKAILYADKSLVKAKQLKNDSLIGLSYNAIANNFQYKTELDSALKYHKKALEIRIKIKDSIGLADTYNNLGIFYDTKGEFSNAVKNYFKALYFYEKKQSIAKQAMVCSNIGIVLKAQKEYNKAIIYYRKSYELYSKTTDDFGKTTSAGNLGSILINLKQYKESLKYSVIAKNGYEKLGYERFVGYPLSSIAYVYDSLHNFKIANIKYLECLRLHKKHQNNFEIAEVSGAFANCLIKQKLFDKSITYSQESLKYSKIAKANLLEINSFKVLAIANSKIGNYQEAFRFSELYNLGKDSVFKTQNAKSIFELETKYQTAKKENLLLEKETEAKQKNIILIIVSILALFITIIAFMIYRQQKLKHKQQEQEFELKSAISQIENQNKLQEQRLNISRDLHDNIGSQLTFIISSVDNVKYAFDIENKKLDDKLTNISSFAKETIVELRDTIWAMNSNEITFEDLESRIHNFIEKAKEVKDDIQFSFEIDWNLKDTKLTSIEGMNIYRTIQEAVNNAIKYADASIIAINAKQLVSETKITIQDNGIGFDSDKIEKGNGLKNMQKRIEEIGGKFIIKSSSEGTRIDILLKNNEI